MKRSVKFVRLCLLFGNLGIINDFWPLILKLSVANCCHIHVTLLPEKLGCAMSTNLNPDSMSYVIMNFSNLLRLMPDFNRRGTIGDLPACQVTGGGITRWKTTNIGQNSKWFILIHIKKSSQ